MKNIKILLLMVIFLLLGCDKKENNNIKIGAILPLTGSAAELASQHKLGLEYGLQILNAAGGVNGRKFELMIEDDQNDPKTTVTTTTKLMAIDKVEVLITVTSSPSLAIAPMIEKSNIPLIANCGHPTITREFKNIYRNFPSTGVEVKRMASFISSTLKLKTIWLLYIDDAFGKGAEQIAEQVFPKHGLVLLGSDPYAKSTSDTKPIVLKALKSKADAIYVYGYGIATAEVVNRLRQLGFKGVLLGSLNFAQPPLTTVSSKAIEGSYYTIPSFEHVGMTASKEFWDGFQSRYDQKPPWNAAVEYDAIMLIAEAVKLNSQQGGGILENLGRIGNFSGVAGKYLYENTKDWELSMSVAQITENGIKYFD